MDPILFLAVGAVIGLTIGLVAATFVTERRHRPRDVAVQVELQAARQRAERAAGEAQAVRAQLVAADIVAARAPALEQALDAARADAEWSAAHVAALEAEVAALRTGRRPRPAPAAAPAPDRSPAGREDPTTRMVMAGAAYAPGIAGDATRTERPGAPNTTGGLSRDAAVAQASAGVAAVGMGGGPPGRAVVPAAVDPTPDPPWMAEAAVVAAREPVTALAAQRAAPPRRERRSMPAVPPVAVLGEVTAPSVEVRAPRSRASTSDTSPVAVRQQPDPDASFPEAPPPARPRTRTRPATPGMTAATARIAKPLPDQAATPKPAPGTAQPRTVASSVSRDAATAATAAPATAPPAAPEPAPPAPPKPHPHGWVSIRPGLSDPWKWLGRMSPAGVPYAQDDLEAIHGVGPYLARRLREEGVLTWRQMAEWDDDDMTLVSRRIGTFPDRIRREDWPASAHALHAARYREALR